jgi:hypothetical protein
VGGAALEPLACAGFPSTKRLQPLLPDTVVETVATVLRYIALVCCPVIILHNYCLHQRHPWRIREDADGGWATQGGGGVER